MIKRFLSVLLAAIMAFTIVAGTVSSVSAAGTEKPFTVKVTSNIFSEQINSYKDINMYEDENGDVFITVECKLYAPEKIVIIFDFELTDEDMASIDGININSRLRYDPDNCDFSIL